MDTEFSFQTKGLKRKTTDKYYTKPEIVNNCIRIIKDNIKFGNKDLIIEPSAGNGSFVEGIKSLSNNCLFFDLYPEMSEIIQQDFLKLNDIYTKDMSSVPLHIIGNPPFGRQSSTCIKFIKKCIEFNTIHSISFILPKSFKKNSLQNRFPLHFHLVHSSDIPDNSFLVNNIEHNVPCVFQIWEKKEYERVQKEKYKPVNFIFCKKTEEPDISFRRVGVNAGFISTEYENKNSQSHYFIKFNNNYTVIKNIKLLENIKFETDNTVGPRSISKQELIEKFNSVLN